MPFFGPDPLNPRFAALRSKPAAIAWRLGALLAAFLLWQHLVGWPIEQSLRLKLGSDFGSASAPYKSGLSHGAPDSDWDTAFARVQENGVDLPRYADLRRLDSVDPSRGGCFIKDGSVFFVPRGGDAEKTANHQFTIRLPWLPKPAREVWLWSAFLLLTALLFWARNPMLLELLGAWRSSAACGLPAHTAALALLAAAAAISLRLRGFSVPFWDGDTRDYLKPALLLAQGGRLAVDPDRPLGYPAFAALLLRLCPDFRSLVSAHGVATLVTGAAIAAVLWLAGTRLFPPGPCRLLVRYAGIAAFGLFTLNEDILEREWALLPEAWACLYMAAQLLLAWRLTASRLTAKRLLAEYALFCIAGWLLFLTKPNWGLALGLLPLPLAIAAVARSQTRAELWKWLAAGLAVTAAVSAAALYAQSACTPESTGASLELRSRVLVLWHLPLVRPEIARRLEEAPSDRYAPVLRELAQLMDDELALAKKNGPGAYRLLGYDPDRILYVGFRNAPLYHALPWAESGALCRELFLAALRRNPGAYLTKVARQVGNLGEHPYGPTVIYLPRLDSSLVRANGFLNTPHTFLPAPIASRYRESLDQAARVFSGCWPTLPRLGLSIRITSLFELLTTVYRGAILIPLAVCAAAALIPAWRRRAPWSRLAPVLVVALWATGSGLLCALTCAISQAFEVQRYIDLFFPLTLFSELLWPFIALALLVAIRNGKQA